MGFDEALGLSFVYGVFGGWLWSDVDIGFLGDWLWTCGYGGVTESTESHLPHPLSLFSLLFFQLF